MKRSALGWRLGAAAAIWACLSSAGPAANVQLTGVEGKLRDAVLGGSLLIEQGKNTENAPTSAEVLAAAQADYRRLLAVLYDNGYFGASINIRVNGREAADIPPVTPPQHINNVTVSIDPGPLFRFGGTSIKPVAQDTELPEEFASGKTASLGVLKQTVSVGIDGWRAKGHAKARLEDQQLTARHTDRTVSAELRLAPGPKLRFGPLVLKSASAVRTERIMDIAALPTGQVFDPEELKLATNRLRRTGAFSAVALIEAEKISPNNSLPIELQVKDEKPRRFGFGAEIATQEGVTLSAFWLHRNLLGGAERLRIEGKISGIGGDIDGEDYTLSARFDRPATFNEDTDFYALAKLEKLQEPLYSSRQIDLEAGIKRIASAEREYRFGIGLRAAREKDAFGENSYSLLTFPAGLTFDYRDNKMDATSGNYLNGDVMPFAAIRGSDNGLRAVFDARYFRTFGEARPITFALRGQIGAVWGPDLARAPADYLFYSGGGGTVRGQPYQSLGVALPNDETVGGRSFVGLSAELRVAATESIGIVGFADAGYIGEEEFYDGSGQWHSGAGLGVRYKTPIGPIRFDVAVPTSGPETGDDFQVYIGIGQAF